MQSISPSCCLPQRSATPASSMTQAVSACYAWYCSLSQGSATPAAVYDRGIIGMQWISPSCSLSQKSATPARVLYKHCRHAVDLAILQSIAEVCYTCFEYDMSIVGMQLISLSCSLPQRCATPARVRHKHWRHAGDLTVLQSVAGVCFTCFEYDTSIVGSQVISASRSLSQRSTAPTSSMIRAVSACS